MSIYEYIFGKPPAPAYEPMEAIIGDPDITGRLEPRSSTWVFIRYYATQELAALRESNDKPYDATQTANVRGQIKALKKLLDLEPGPGNRPQAPAGNAGEDGYYE